MKTGTDMNLCTCRAEGYAVVEHGKSKLNPQQGYRLTISNPDAWTDNGKTKFGEKLYFAEGFYSYCELWESFERGGNGIKSYCDFENCPLPSPTEEPTFSDFVHLAQTIFYHQGLD